MALEITRRADGGITLCTNVCTALTPADVAMLDKQARAYHGRLHAGATSGSALGPDIIGDDDVGGRKTVPMYTKWEGPLNKSGRYKLGRVVGRLKANGLLARIVTKANTFRGKSAPIYGIETNTWKPMLKKVYRWADLHWSGSVRGDLDMGYFMGDDDDSIVVKAVKLPFTGLKYAGKGAWWVTKESGKGVGKGIASLFSGDGREEKIKDLMKRFQWTRKQAEDDLLTRESGVFGDDVGLPLQRRGGHMEIMGPASNREFLRERRHMGGYYEEVGERFPADGVGKGVAEDFNISKGSRRKAAEPYRRAYLEEADVIKALGQSGRPINGGTLAGYIRLKSRYASIKNQRSYSPERREQLNQILRAKFAALGWEVLGTSNVAQAWSGPAPAKGAAWEYANANQAK